MTRTTIISRWTRWTAVLAGVGMLLGAAVRGDAAEGRFHWGTTTEGPRGGYRVYDNKTVETTEGQVAKINRIPGRKGGFFVQVDLKTPTETIPVFLGPENYLVQQAVQLAVNDEITVKGSRVKVRQKVMLLAAEVRKGEAMLALRDANGAGLWSGSPADEPGGGEAGK